MICYSIIILLVNSFLILLAIEIHAREDVYDQLFDQLNTTIAVTEGQTVYLDCNVQLKGNKTVAWVRHHNGIIQLITYGHSSFHDDRRFSLSYQPPGNWRLRLVAISQKDSGRYECQISSHPPLKKSILLLVSEPSIRITDASGSRLNEILYMGVASPLSLRCVMEPISVYNKNKLFWQFNGDLILQSDDHILFEEERFESRLIQWMHILQVQKEDEGYYSCTSKHSKGKGVKIIVVREENSSSMIQDAGNTFKLTWAAYVSLIITNLIHSLLLNYLFTVS